MFNFATSTDQQKKELQKQEIPDLEGHLNSISQEEKMLFRTTLYALNELHDIYYGHLLENWMAWLKEKRRMGELTTNVSGTDCSDDLTEGEREEEQEIDHYL